MAHENGAIESQHGHLKRTVIQALLLRGGVDFESLDAYRGWIANLIGRRNARRAKMVQLECTALPLLWHSTCCAGGTLASVARCRQDEPPITTRPRCS